MIRLFPLLEWVPHVSFCVCDDGGGITFSFISKKLIKNSELVDCHHWTKEKNRMNTTINLTHIHNWMHIIAINMNKVIRLKMRVRRGIIAWKVGRYDTQTTLISDIDIKMSSKTIHITHSYNTFKETHTYRLNKTENQQQLL